ncbi:MAG TPA: hypothetical protein VIK91_11145 [Nannocystis sp.]
MRLHGRRHRLVALAALERFHHRVELAEAGDFLGLQLTRDDPDLHRDDVRSGQALVAGAPPELRRLHVALELLPPDPGRGPPIGDGHTSLVMFGATAIE